jgi:hypothetical protein
MQLMRGATLEITAEECRALAEQLRGCKPELTEAAEVKMAESFALYLEALARRKCADAQPA